MSAQSWTTEQTDCKQYGYPSALHIASWQRDVLCMADDGIPYYVDQDGTVHNQYTDEYKASVNSKRRGTRRTKPARQLWGTHNDKGHYIDMQGNVHTENNEEMEKAIEHDREKYDWKVMNDDKDDSSEYEDDIEESEISLNIDSDYEESCDEQSDEENDDNDECEDDDDDILMELKEDQELLVTAQMIEEEFDTQLPLEEIEMEKEAQKQAKKLEKYNKLEQNDLAKHKAKKAKRKKPSKNTKNTKNTTKSNKRIKIQQPTQEQNAIPVTPITQQIATPATVLSTSNTNTNQSNLPAYFTA